MRNVVAATLAASLLLGACATQPVPTQPPAGAPAAVTPLTADVEVLAVEDVVLPDGREGVRLTYRTQGILGDIAKAVTAPVKAAGKAVGKVVGKGAKVVGGALGVIKDDILDPLFGDLAKLGKAAIKHVPLLKSAFNAVNKALSLVGSALDDLMDKIAGKSAAQVAAMDKRDLVATLVQLDKALGKLQVTVASAGPAVTKSAKLKAPINQLSKKIDLISEKLPPTVADDIRVKSLLRRLRIRVTDLKDRTERAR